jgi:hypothetical protein
MLQPSGTGRPLDSYIAMIFKRWYAYLFWYAEGRLVVSEEFKQYFIFLIIEFQRGHLQY